MVVRRTVWNVAGAAALAVATLGGCAPLVVGGAMVGGALVAADRRSVGIQVEDEAIESRINRAIAERVPRESANVTVTSYNRRVLLTGEATTAPVREQIEALAKGAENVRAVENDIFVAPLTTVAQRNNDLAIAARLQAALLADPAVPSTAIETVTQRGIVYLMGRVTEAEGEAAARVAARVQGVQRVVKVFDFLTEAEAAEFRKAPAKPPQTGRP
jgi:osmotically-inducible protein OsmY